MQPEWIFCYTPPCIDKLFQSYFFVAYHGKQFVLTKTYYHPNFQVNNQPSPDFEYGTLYTMGLTDKSEDSEWSWLHKQSPCTRKHLAVEHSIVFFQTIILGIHVSFRGCIIKIVDIPLPCWETGESEGKLSKRNWKVYVDYQTMVMNLPDSARNASRMRRWWTYLLQIQIHSLWSRPCASDTSRMGSKVNHVENQHESPSFARSMRRLCVTLAVRCGASIDISVFCAGTSI